ncbi:MAG: hypothetical protein MAG451_03078 [Anaerolineales bacterium]|nr:hypothetical protein [Anaerolineales bacterium]
MNAVRERETQNVMTAIEVQIMFLTLLTRMSLRGGMTKQSPPSKWGIAAIPWIAAIQGIASHKTLAMTR